ncbi:hypothetical protein [Mesorhizobium sp. 131-2-1]|uniref:hypothetical protein n=1 Tax=Mesorhizobium sp. 131-2-1 TaxID=2744518 RepID=UPI001927B1C3|nr:hypothetical protein [Mesorhizobium sp. 131-2-1]
MSTRVDHLKNKVNLPPMPWYQVQAMSDSDLRSIYLYIKSLGAPGELAPGSLAKSRRHLT